MKKTTILLLAAILATGCAKQTNEICIIPQPQQLEVTGGTYDFGKVACVISENTEAASFIASELSKLSGTEITTTPAEGKDAIEVNFVEDIPEKYVLSVADSGISITASDYQGAVHALYSLMQLFPEEFFKNWYNPASVTGKIDIPKCHIEDYPRFGYRGMHLDVSRHFFTTDEIKRYLDIMALHKLNRFHWHLTDDPGWRLEIKAYPLLTSVAAWRAPRPIGSWDSCEPWQECEENTYGGFYTQEEAKEIVKYAAERGIEVIPEIEIPGHSSEVFAAYPTLSCGGKPQPLPTGGSNGYSKSPSSVYCAGNEEVYNFLETVLKEVVEVFPDAPYIHIGGDEVSKEAWKHCRKCQNLMKSEGLQSEEELQSYMIKRVETIVNALGKPIIGWDEILEGGIAPNATIMSWRGISGGIVAAKADHDVIMTPGSHLYFDFYQDKPEGEPKAIGGFLTTKKVYSFEPIPEELTEEEGKHILGAQANVWTEYIGTFDHVEYMVLPRACALSEVDWSSKESRNWEDFSRRLAVHSRRLANIGYNIHHGATDVEIETSQKNNTFLVTMTSQIYGTQIRYTLDGSEPDASSPEYTKPIEIDQSVVIKANVFKDEEPLSSICTERRIGYHKALGCKIAYKYPASSDYSGRGDITLVDGLSGAMDLKSGMLQGFCETDMEVVIDLGEKTAVSSVNAGFVQTVGSWVYLPTELKIFLSDDGENFTEAGSIKVTADPKAEPSCHKDFNVEFEGEARYVKVVAVNEPTPEGLPGAGKINWIFCDEIVVN